MKFGIAKEELNQHKQALERASKNSEAIEKISRPGKHRSVRPPTQTGRAGIEIPDRFLRPVRPVAPRKPAIRASNGESRANEVQIQRNLEDSFATNLRTYPQEIFPKRSKKLENLREDQEELGFSLELKNCNSGELVIQEGLALG